MGNTGRVVLSLEQFQQGQGKQPVFLWDQPHDQKRCSALAQWPVLAKCLIEELSGQKIRWWLL